MTRGRMIITTAAAVCLLAGLVFWPTTAQTRQPTTAEPQADDSPQGRMGPPHGPLGSPEGMSAELKETIQLYMIYRLTEELGLNDEQSLKIMPLIKEREKIRWEHFQRQQELQQTLAGLLEDKESSEAEIENAITAIRQSEADLHQRENQLDLEVAALLTTRQHAQFILFQQTIHNEIRQRVHRMRGMHGNSRRRPAKP